MGAWILIVSFAASTVSYKESFIEVPGQPVLRTREHPSHHIAMQEFASLPACQHTSIEAQKIAPGIRVVCVPKG